MSEAVLHLAMLVSRMCSSKGREIYLNGVQAAHVVAGVALDLCQL